MERASKRAVQVSGRRIPTQLEDELADGRLREPRAEHVRKDREGNGDQGHEQDQSNSSVERPLIASRMTVTDANTAAAPGPGSG